MRKYHSLRVSKLTLAAFNWLAVCSEALFVMVAGFGCRTGAWEDRVLRGAVVRLGIVVPAGVRMKASPRQAGRGECFARTNSVVSDLGSVLTERVGK